MKQGELLILGSSAAVPTGSNSPTSQILSVSGLPYLIDAGEGVQERLRTFKVRFQKIPVIFISHLHGDHVLGLPGLIGTMNLLGRNAPLKIVGPKGIREFLEVIHRLTASYQKFPLSVQELEFEDSTTLVHEDGLIRVWSVPVNHRVTTFGYKFQPIQGKRKIAPNALKELELTAAEMKVLVKGESFERTNGDMLTPEDCCLPIPDPWTYVYSADTRPCKSIVEAAQGATLLYHESTYLEDKAELAKKTHHSTASEAGEIAKQACVQKLILGHFSNRYGNLELLREEAASAFDGPVELGLRGARFLLS